MIYVIEVINQQAMFSLQRSPDSGETLLLSMTWTLIRVTYVRSLHDCFMRVLYNDLMFTQDLMNFLNYFIYRSNNGLCTISM